jgi:uncharacterized protein
MSKLALKAWSQTLRNPATPGMDDASPRARWLPFLLMMLALAAQVTLRYEWGVLNDNAWQGVHLLIGLSSCLLILRAFHGPEVLRRVRPRTWALLAIALVSFLAFWHLGRIDSYRRWWLSDVDPTDPFAPVYGFMYFSSSSTLFRLMLPFAIAWAAMGLRPRDLGLHSRSNAFKPSPTLLWPVYLALFIGVLPFVLHVAQTAPFLAKYPLGRAMIRDGVIQLEHLLVHEGFYLLVFVSGEAFWRGFMTFSLERDFGLYALALMIVPYVTAHFGKPLPETLGAIIAGGLLGWLALKHRSIWLGVAVHFGVALTMDLLAIRYNGFTIEMP